MSREIAGDNVIRLADRFETRLGRYMPLLEASGVLLDPWAGDLLSQDLADASSTLGRALVGITERAAAEQSLVQLRTAALLRRVQSAIKMAAKRAEKLESKLSKAKRKAKRRC